MVDESFWEPLPPLEDLISGKFKRSQRKEERENYWNGAKFDEPEEGEVEEGEIEDDDNHNNKAVQPAKRAKTQVSSKALSNEQNQNRNQNQKQNNQSKNQNQSQNQKQKQTKEEKQAFVPRIVCRYFMDGVCSKGSKCTFSHAATPNRTAEEARVKDACKFFIAGSCMKGSACHFSHELSKFPCKFFHLKGECAAALKGCRFSHDPISPDELERLRTAETERINEKERAIQTLNSLKSSSSRSGELPSLATTVSASKAANQPEKTAAENEQMALHSSLVNPFAEFDDV